MPYHKCTYPMFFMATATNVNDDASTTTSISTESSAPAVAKKSTLLTAWVMAGVFLLLTIVFSLVSIALCYIRYGDKLGIKRKRTREPKITSKLGIHVLQCAAKLYAMITYK